MEVLLRHIAGTIALTLEAVAVLIVVFGALGGLRAVAHRSSEGGVGAMARRARLRLGRWLVLGLEFQLAADVIRTAISPTWVDLGQLAAVATIRTALNYFLGRDLAEIESPAVSGERHHEAGNAPTEVAAHAAV